MGKTNSYWRTLANLTKRFTSGALSLAIGLSGLAAAAPLFFSQQAVAAASTVAYSTMPSSAQYPGSFPSQGYEATQTSELGDYVQLAGTNRKLSSIRVSLTSWACENDFTKSGNDDWVRNRADTDACVTNPNSNGYKHDITLNVYNVDTSSGTPVAGTLIASQTKNATIPFRPSYDPANTHGCAAPTADIPFGGTWYDSVTNKCVHGQAFDVTFSGLTAANTILPNDIIVAVAYNTSHYGTQPIGQSGPYDSLNLSLTTNTPSEGTNVESDVNFLRTSGALNRDSGWGGYTPVMKINTLAEAPAPTVVAQDFGVGFWTLASNGFAGIDVGFRTDNFTHVDAIKVTLQKNGSDIVSNTASAALLSDINTTGGVFNQNGQISTPFVTDGTLNDTYCGGVSCWNADSHVWRASEKPDTAVITVTQDGTNYPATITNFSETSSSFDAIVPQDTEAPTVSFTSPTEGKVFNGTPSFELTSSDDIAIRNITSTLYDSANNMVGWKTLAGNLNAPTFTTSGPVTYDTSGTPLPDGDYKMVADVQDMTGKHGPQAVLHVHIDHTAPSVTFTQPSADAVRHDLKISVEMDGTGANLVQYGFDVSGPNGAYFSTANYHVDKANLTLTDFDLCAAAYYGTCPSQLPDGTYTVRAKAYDAAGNRNITTTRAFTIDNTGPVVTINAPNTDIATNDDSVAVNVTVTDNHALNTLSVYLTDAAGNYKNGCTSASNLDAYPTWITSYTTDCNLATSNLVDGTYKLIAKSQDRAGNDSNTATRLITVDNTAPATPTINTPTARQWFKSTPIVNSWTAATDNTGVAYYQIAYNYDDGHSFGGSTCPSLTIAGVSGFLGCRDVNGTSRDHQLGTNEQGGVTIWVRAIDNAGNASPWSKSVHYYYDYEAPTTNINVTVTGGTLTVSGDATDNLSLNRVYVQLVNRENGQRYGGTTINLIGQDQNASWSKTYDMKTLGYPDGNYAAHASVTDMAGNSGTAGWTNNYVIDTVNPAITASMSETVITRQTTTDPTVTINASDTGSGIDYVQYKVMDNAGSTVLGWMTINNNTATPVNGLLSLADGSYTLRARAYDNSGNKKSGSDVAFTIDRTAPTLKVNSSTGTDNTPTITGTTSADTKAVVVTIDGHDYTAVIASDGTWSADVTNALAVGTYNATVVSTDNAGNSTTETASVEVTSEPDGTTTATTTPQGSTSQNRTFASAGTATSAAIDSATSSVLGAEGQSDTMSGSTDNNATKELKNAKATTCAKLLGVCWYYWIPIVLIVGYIVYRYFRSADENQTSAGRR